MAVVFIYENHWGYTNAFEFNDISNQQDAAKFVLLILLSFLYMFQATVSPIFRSTLCIQLVGTTYRLCCQSAADSRVGTLFQKTVYTKCFWRWVKLSPETCRESLKESIKQILLHLVGCWYHWTSDTRSHNSQAFQFICFVSSEVINYIK